MPALDLPELTVQGLELEADAYWAVWWIRFDRPSIAPDPEDPRRGWIGLHAHKADADETCRNLVAFHRIRPADARVRALTLPEAFDLVRNLETPIPTVGRRPFDGLKGVLVVDREPDGTIAVRYLPA